MHPTCCAFGLLGLSLSIASSFALPIVWSADDPEATKWITPPQPSATEDLSTKPGMTDAEIAKLFRLGVALFNPPANSTPSTAPIHTAITTLSTPPTPKLALLPADATAPTLDPILASGSTPTLVTFASPTPINIVVPT